MPNRLVKVDVAKQLEQQNAEMLEELKTYFGEILETSFNNLQREVDSKILGYETQTTKGISNLETVIIGQRNDSTQIEMALKQEIEDISSSNRKTNTE